MGEPAAKLPPTGPQRTGAIEPTLSRTKSASPGAAASFEALLENLEQKAQALDAKARAELAPDELAQAVDEARSSLEDALALQERLLEAWRQSKHQARGDVEPPRAPGKGER